MSADGEKSIIIEKLVKIEKIDKIAKNWFFWVFLENFTFFRILDIFGPL
jgi:hypothetical protein